MRSEISPVAEQPVHRSSAGRGRPLLVLLLAVLLFGALFVYGLLPRLSRNRTLNAASDQVKNSPLEVTTAIVKTAPAEVDITLPGDIQALTEASIYARASGYIRKRYVDIGDRVKTGQLLVDIESPELESQVQQARASILQSQSALAQAEAAVEQAKASRQFAAATERRSSQLVKRGVLSLQEGDQNSSALAVREADVAAAEANVKVTHNLISVNQANLSRLLDLQSYTKVRAPFDGVITARNIDVGSLVTEGTGSSGKELFRMAQSSRLRIFVNVPQSEVPAIHVGEACTLTVREFGAQSFPATIARTADSLDPANRTLLVELQLPNPTGKLLPGMYAQAKFHLKRDVPPLLVPSDTLLTNATGQHIAVVQNGHIHLQTVKTGNDYGPQIEILSGLNKGDTIIVSLTDEIQEGRAVQPIANRQ